MTAEIHITLEDGSEDFVIVTGEDADDVHVKACVEVIARGGRDPWSRVLDMELRDEHDPDFELPIGAAPSLPMDLCSDIPEDDR